MKRTNPMLLIDFYKAVHAEMLPQGITKSVSYFTPRMSRVKRWDKVVMFGLQGFIKTYLIDYFNEEFFNKPFNEVIAEYKRIMDATLGENTYKIDKIEELHKLGYLPIEIQSKIAKTFGVSLEEVYGIATFYAQFNLKPKGKYTIGICMGTACYVKGGGDILEKFKEKLGIGAGDTTDDKMFTLEATRCIGCCGLAPVLTVNEEVYGNLTVDDVDGILAKYN